MLVNDYRLFSSHSFNLVTFNLKQFFDTLTSISLDDFYNKLFNFNYDFPNHDLLNIMSLYGYILSIEIIIVLCVLFVHSSILDSDSSELAHDSSFEDVYYLFDNYCDGFIVECYLSVHNNVSIGIGHNIESFLDFFFLVIPTSIILYILIPSLGLLYNKEFLIDYTTFSFVIDIVGHQWYWTYQYKLHIDSMFEFFIEENALSSFDSIMIDQEPRLLCVDNPLYIPTHTNILLAVTSADVIHSFALPSAGIKIDAIPGRIATSSMFVIGEHDFYGQCSELCGANHGFMPIMVRSISRSMWFSIFVNSTEYSNLF